MVDERRRHARRDSNINVKLRVVLTREMTGESIAFDGTLIDYSESGARVSTAASGHGKRLQERLEKEPGVAVCEIVVQGSPITLRLCGEIRWARLHGQRRDLELGMRFIGDARADVAVIDALSNGHQVMPGRKRSLGLIVACVLCAAGALYFWSDAASSAHEVTRLKTELDGAEERRENLSKRLRAADERIHELQKQDAPPPLPTPVPAQLTPPPPAPSPSLRAQDPSDSERPDESDHKGD